MLFQCCSKTPILLNEIMRDLSVVSGGIYVDGTFGHGGHSREILSRLDSHGKLFAIDRDYASVRIGKLIASEDKRFIIIHGRFSKLFRYMKDFNLIGQVNGILLDLGLSRFQLENHERGFSFLKDGPLDMRMDNSCGLSASNWLRRASLEKIVWVLKTFGEEKFAKKIAKSIVIHRQRGGMLSSTHELVRLIINSIPCYDKYKHPATRTFQAIRIYINDELQEIKKVLEAALCVLSPGGRLLVVSFHSLEDRIVKHFIREHGFPISIISNNRGNLLYQKKISIILSKYNSSKDIFFGMNHLFDRNKCYLRLIRKVFPSNEEIRNNISSRSAVLRCIEKIIA